MTSPFIVTVGGTRFHFDNPTPEQIDIQHIAHALAVQPRFTGHTNWWDYGRAYSVGQHSAVVSAIINLAGGSVIDQLWGLLHDASEAYMGDCNAPLKSLLPDFRRIENTVMVAICQRFGLDPECPAIVHWADKHALCLESSDLLHPAMAALYPVDNAAPMAGQKLVPWEPRFTYLMFLRTFEELRKRLYAS